MSTRMAAKAVLSSFIPVVAMWGVVTVPAGAQVTGPGPIDSVDHFLIAYGFKISGGLAANLNQCVPGALEFLQCLNDSGNLYNPKQPCFGHSFD